MVSMLARLSEDGGVIDDIAAVRAELEETQAKLQASWHEMPYYPLSRRDTYH
jgi:hypothetical protein